MPNKRRLRFIQEYKLSFDDAVTLTENRYLADYYEQLTELTGEAKASASLILTSVLRVLNEKGWKIQEFTIQPDRLAGLIELRSSDKINSTAMNQIFDQMVDHPESAGEIAEKLNVMQVSDVGFLDPIVERVLAEHPDEVEKYKSGKTALIGFFIGKIMQQSGGKANPEQARKTVMDKLS